MTNERVVWERVADCSLAFRGFDDPWVAAPHFSVPPKRDGDDQRRLSRRIGAQDVRSTFLALAEMGMWFGDRFRNDPTDATERWRVRAVATEMKDMLATLLTALDDSELDNDKE